MDLPEPVGPVTRIKSARTVAQLGDHGRKIELGEAFDLKRNDAEDRGNGAALVEDVGAETRQTLQPERKVQLEILFKAVLLSIGHHRVGQLLGVGRTQRRHIQRLQVAVDPNLRRRIGGDVKIAAAEFEQLLQQIAECYRHSISLTFQCDTPVRCRRRA